MATGRPAGRPPKPVELKQQEGNLGRRALPELGLGVEKVDIPKMPVGYTAKDKEARAVWTTLWESSRSLKTTDYFAAVRFLEAWMEYLRYSRGFRDGSLQRTHENSNGTMQSHPHWVQFKDIKQDCNTLMSSLGLTPADRARLFLAEEVDEDMEAIKGILAGGRQGRNVS